MHLRVPPPGRHGGHRLFGETLATWTARASNIARRVGLARQDGSDVLQSAVARFVASGRALPVEPHPDARLLCRMLKFAAIEASRHRRHVRRVESEWAAMLFRFGPRDGPRASPSCDLEELSTREQAERLLRELPDAERWLLERWSRGALHAEMARELGISEASFRQRLRRLLAKIRQDHC